MQIPRPYSRLTESESLRLEPKEACSSKPSKGIWHLLTLERHHIRTQLSSRTDWRLIITDASPVPAIDPSLLLTVINLDGHIGGIMRHPYKLVKRLLSMSVEVFPERLPRGSSK